MRMRNKKLLLVTLAALSTVSVTVATQTDPVAASPYVSGYESNAAQNTKQIVISLFDADGKPVTWIQKNGDNGGSSIEYLNQNGDMPGLSLIKLPDNLIAHSASMSEPVLTSEQGNIFSVMGGKFYVNLSAIPGTVAKFKLNVEQAVEAQPDVVPDTDNVPDEPVHTATDVVPNEPVYVTSSAVVPNEPVYMTSSAVVPNEPVYMTSSAVVPNEPVVAPAVPHSGASVTDLTPVIPAESAAVSSASDSAQTNKPVAQPAVTSVSVAPSVIAQAASVANAAPVAASTRVITTPIATAVGAVTSTSVATSQTPGPQVQSTPVSEPAAQTQDEVQAVKKPDLISSISDLPKASMWTDKARTFSAISIGMSAMAVAAQFLMSKLGFLKNLL